MDEEGGEGGRIVAAGANLRGSGRQGSKACQCAIEIPLVRVRMAEGCGGQGVKHPNMQYKHF